MTSRTFVRGAAAGLATSLFLLSAPEVSAQLTLAGSPLCTAFDGFVANGASVSYVACGGAFEGNNKQEDVAGWVLNNWGLDISPAGNSEPGDDPGVFADQFGQGGTTGTLNFTGIQGVFVLALKAGPQFSLYQFNTGGDIWTTLVYGTSGVSLGGNGNARRAASPNALSHASVYLGPSNVVPEPSTVVLLLTGLATMGFVVWRKREETVS